MWEEAPGVFLEAKRPGGSPFQNLEGEPPMGIRPTGVLIPEICCDREMSSFKIFRVRYHRHGRASHLHGPENPIGTPPGARTMATVTPSITGIGASISSAPSLSALS